MAAPVLDETYFPSRKAAVAALRRDAARFREAGAVVDAGLDGGSFAATGRLDETALAMPHVLLLPSAPVGRLPALRSDADATRPTFACHTRVGKVGGGVRV